MASNSQIAAAIGHCTEELVKWCKERLSAAAVPTSVTLLPQMPLSAGGKLMRGGLPPPPWASEAVSRPLQAQSEGASLRPLSQPQQWHVIVQERSEDISTPSSVVPGDVRRADLKLPGSTGHDVPLLPGDMRTDSHRLPAQDTGIGPQRTGLSGGLEGRVLGLLRRALGLPRLEPSDHFFHAGGDSLAAAAVANALVIHPDLITAFPTARKLSAALQQTSSSLSPGSHVTPGVPPHATCDSTESKTVHTRSVWQSGKTNLDEVPQLPRLNLNSSLIAAVATPEEEANRQQQARQALAACTQAGGWVFERAGALRWAGTCTPGSMRQTLDSLINPKSRMSDASHVSTQLNCSWRFKLKECIDASPVVLVALCAKGSWQQEQHQCLQRQQQQQQHEAQEWVFAGSHGGADRQGCLASCPAREG